ncbi:uncharacterized protein LOC111132491 [Crassostrea virginica]
MSVFRVVLFVSWFFILTTCQVLTNIDVTCPLDWVQHPTYKNKCYRLGGSAVPYSFAPAGCQGLKNESTVANIYNLEIHNFLIDGFLSPNKEYYTSLKRVSGAYVFTELNNEPLEVWNVWGTITGDTCTVYSNVGGVWYWQTNNCLQSCLYICEYTVPTPGALPMVLVPVNSVPMSGRIEIFWSGMWGVLRDSEFPETVAIICNDLGHSTNTGAECTSVETCGTGQIWYERVSCDPSHANLSDCLAAGAKLSTQTDHSKDTIVSCGDPLSTPEATTLLPDTTTIVEVTTTHQETTEQTTIEQTTTEQTTTRERTTYQETTVVSSEPITPQNNVTVIYQNVTTVVNVTVTETATVYVTTTVPLTASIACLPSSQLMTTPTTSDQTTNDIITSSETPVDDIVNAEPLPVLKAKNSAMYSTKTRQDQRPSAQVIGSFGIIIVVVILMAIVALDLGTVGKEISRAHGRKTSAVSKKRVKQNNRMKSRSTCHSPDQSHSTLSMNSL